MRRARSTRRDAQGSWRWLHTQAAPRKPTPSSTSSSRAKAEGPEESFATGYPTTRFRPDFFALYRLASATLMKWVGSVMSWAISATPMEMVTGISFSS